MKVCKVGDGLAVLLPADMVERLGLHEGDEVDVLRVEKRPALSQAQIDAMFDELRKLRGRVPADYKFKRSDAYEDGDY